MESNSNNGLSNMTGGRQTMMSWARVIETYAAVPEVFKAACKATLAESSPFPYVVLAPAIQGSLPRATEKLLCIVNDVLYVWECANGQVIPSTYPLKAICALEMGSILLNSWMTISGLTSEGLESSTVIPFNTATRRHLAPLINKMRPAPTQTAEIDWQAERAKFDALSQVSFKFMNFARESLVRGEKVIDMLWQAPIGRPIFTIFGGPSYRTDVLAHLLILTDKEIILIHDDERSTEKKGVRYGGVWQYISLRHITALTISDAVNDQVVFSLTLAGSEQRLDQVFAASSLQALDHFQNEFARQVASAAVPAAG